MIGEADRRMIDVKSSGARASLARGTLSAGGEWLGREEAGRVALALYRKYRPRTFAEVIGQEHVTEPLSQALRTGRLHHAYLFSGPRGCGKTSSARILARSLNCEQGPTPDPCGVCESCRALAADGTGSIDVIEIDAASHGGVDDARELRERAFFAPVNSRFKIYVIDEAHMVSTQGFNALLKLVEEPPEYVKFIFATTEPEKVLGTIKSRTHHYPFRLIPPGVLRPYLERLAEAEGVTIEPAVFPLLVRAGGGSVRDTLSVLDQLIAGAGPEGVSYARAVALLGVTDSALIDEMCDALAAGDGAAAYATIDRVAEAGHDPRRFAADLLERLRDLIILRQVPDAIAKGLVDGPADQLERMASQAERLGPATLSRCADIVHNGLVEMRGTTAPRLLLELICARMFLPGAEDSTGSLLQRLERVERRLAGVGDLAPPPPAAGSAPPASATPSAAPTAPVVSPRADTPAPPAGPPTGRPAPPATAPTGPAGSPARPTTGPAGSPTRQPSPEARPTGSGSASPAQSPSGTARPTESVTASAAGPAPTSVGSADIGMVEQSWAAIVEGTKHRRVVWSLLQNVSPYALDRDTLVLRAQTAGIANRFSDDNVAGVVRDAIRAVLGVQWQIRCEVAGAGGAGPARPGPASAVRPTAPAPRPSTAPSRANGASARPAGVAVPAGRGTPGTGNTGVGAAVGAGEEDDWPEPARPGGSAPSEPAPADDDWPEPVVPGGAAGTSTGGGGSAGTAAGGGGVRANGAAAGRGTVRGGGAPGAGAPGGGIAAARAAAAGRANRPAAPAAEQDWAGEPPYDPEYDGPVRRTGGPAATPTVSYEGFDPGDEPLDEVVDEQTARQTSEQQAVQLLQQALGAERIGEIDLR